MTKPTQSRELILDILMEILEKGGYSHVVLRQALELSLIHISEPTRH